MILAIALGSAILYAQKGGCKDSIFNYDLTQFICKQALLGDWKVDSVSFIKANAPDSAIDLKIEQTYTFYPSGDLYINSKMENGKKMRETANCIHYKGNLLLINLTAKGFKVLVPLKYHIETITDNRMVIIFMAEGTVPTSRTILKKIK